MSVIEGGPNPANIIQRVINILTKPAAEWDVIATENATPQSLMLGYAVILSAIPAIAGFIGLQVFGVGGFGITFHPPLVGGLISMVVNYVIGLAVLLGEAFLLDALAPSFGGEKNFIQALKLVVYSTTPAWVVGILSIVPMLGLLVLVALIYGFYVFFIGVPKLVKVPDDKRIGYIAVYVVAAIVAFFVIGMITRPLTAPGAGALHIGGNTPAAGSTVTVNGTTVDLNKLANAANQAAASAQAAQNGQSNVPAVDPEKLKALLPATVAGLPRTELTASSAGAAGFNASNVEAVYSNDTSNIRVTVTDIAAMQGFAAMAGAMNVNSSRETQTGYERTSTVNGRLTTEEWDRESKNGRYSIVVANRFEVKASGNANSIDDLKAAVSAVGPDRLEQLAHG